MLVAVVLVAITCLTNIGKNVPVGTPVKTTVDPLSINTSTSPLFPTYKQTPLSYALRISLTPLVL